MDALINNQNRIPDEIIIVNGGGEKNCQSTLVKWKSIFSNIKIIKTENINFDYICCIYPTAAMIKPHDLKNSFKLIINDKWSFVMSAQKYSTQIERSFKLSNQKIVLIDKKKFIKNSQNFHHFYHDAGQFYWGNVKSWYSKNTILDNKSTIYELKKYQAIDINTLDDWKLAEKLYKINFLK